MVARESEGGGAPDPASAHPVSGNFFDVLGVGAIEGRPLIPSDDDDIADGHVAVASYGFWTRRFGRSTSAIGTTVRLRDVPFTIVGVLPASFHGTVKGRDPDLYIPLQAMTELFGPTVLSNTNSRVLRVMGRLRNDTTADAAQREMDLLWREFVESGVFASLPAPIRPDPDQARINVIDGSAGYEALQDERQTSLLLLGALVGLILLIGCLNVACLLLARSAARRNEIAIRLSLGASAAAILRQSLIESVLLASAGAVAGIISATTLGGVILFLLQGQSLLRIATDSRVLVFGAGVTLMSAALCGLLPAYFLLRNGRDGIRPSAGGSSATPSFAATRILVIAQVTLSLSLLAASGMFLRGFQSIRSIPLGFNAEDVVVVHLESDGASRTNTIEMIEEVMSESIRVAETLSREARFSGVTVSDSVPFRDASIVYSLTGVDGDGPSGGGV